VIGVTALAGPATTGVRPTRVRPANWARDGSRSLGSPVSALPPFIEPGELVGVRFEARVPRPAILWRSVSGDALVERSRVIV
jgi:hypothetical protein